MEITQQCKMETSIDEYFAEIAFLEFITSEDPVTVESYDFEWDSESEDPDDDYDPELEYYLDYMDYLQQSWD